MIENYDLANYFINQSVKRYRSRQNKHRRALINKFLDYYSGDNVDKYISERFKASAFQEIPPVCFNLMRRLIDRMSRIYTLGASRNVNDQYTQMTIMKDYKMKHIEKMTRLLGTVAVEIRLTGIETGLPHYSYNPIYNFDVHFADNDPFSPIALIYPIMMPVHDEFTHADNKLQYAYWDSQYFIIYDDKGETLQQTEHGLGVLPFVFTHREHQLDQFFVHGAYDILSANEAINILYTEMALGMRFQMFGQYSITGIYQDEKMQRTGSDEMLILPEGTTFDIKAPNSNVQDAIELVKSIIDLVAQNNHLYVTFASEGGEVPSGIALKIKDLERFEDYQDDIELWRIHEFKIYELERHLADHHDITLPPELGIDFHEPDYPKTTQDEIAMHTWLLENNLTTRAKLMVKHNNDLTEEEAQVIIDENKDINAKATPEETGGIFSRLRGQTPVVE